MFTKCNGIFFFDLGPLGPWTTIIINGTAIGNGFLNNSRNAYLKDFFHLVFIDSQHIN